MFSLAAVLSQLKSWVLRILCPLVLLCQCVVPHYQIWAITFDMNRTPRDPVPGYGSKPAGSLPRLPWVWAMFALHWFFFCLWFPPLVYLLLVTWTRPFRRLPAQAVPGRRGRYYQVDKSGAVRFCETCGDWMGTRVGHSEYLGRRGRCLPWFDHDCIFLASPVWRNVAKPYLHFLVGLFFHQIFLLAYTATAVHRWKLVPKIFSLFWVVAVCGWFFLFAAVNIFRTVLDWVSRASLGAEQDAKLVFFRETDNPRTILFWDVKDIRGSPFNLGWKRNARLVFGEGWSPLFFWTTTPLMELDEPETCEPKNTLRPAAALESAPSDFAIALAALPNVSPATAAPVPDPDAARAANVEWQEYLARRRMPHSSSV